ncbi:unnamed protein product [Tenebrio molitor]|nr:unnamed protein product [Tenebrio molitor]
MWLENFWNYIFFLFSQVNRISDREYVSMPTLFHFDDYDHCMLEGDNALYCAITYQLHPKNSENISETWNLIQKVSSSRKNYRHDLLRHGICVSKTCPNVVMSDVSINNLKFVQDLEECYNLKYKNLGLGGKIQKIRCENNESPYSVNTFDYLFGTFLLFFILLIIFAWLYDVFLGPNTENDLKNLEKTFFGKYISSFSLSQNWNRLHAIDLEDPVVKALSGIQGVRFFCMVSVIFSHCSSVNFAMPVSNPRYTEAVPDRFSVRWLGNGSRYTTIQTFFLMSAWLVTYQFFANNEGKKEVSLSYFFRSCVSRYFRLTPLIAIVVGCFGTWMPHIGRGPFWDDFVGTEYRACRTNWWSNLLYVNNFVHLDKMCAPQLWYMAIDTQFYIFALLILCLTWKNPKRTTLILGTIWIFHVIDAFLVVYQNDYEVSIPLYPEIFYNLTLVHAEETLLSYKTNTSNIPGFLAGIVYGYAFYKYRNKKLFTKKIHTIAWWILSSGLAILIILVPGVVDDYNLFSENRTLYSAIYASLNRSIFIFGIGFWIFGMTQGQGHIFKSACEWPPMYVLGRLTYSAYLFHTFIQRVKIGMKRTPNYMNDYLMIMDSTGDLALSYLAALLVTLFFEMPFAEIKKHVTAALKKSRSREDNLQKLDNKKSD